MKLGWTSCMSDRPRRGGECLACFPLVYFFRCLGAIFDSSAFILFSLEFFGQQDSPLASCLNHLRSAHAGLLLLRVSIGSPCVCASYLDTVHRLVRKLLSLRKT